MVARAPEAGSPAVTELVYELLDAHADTLSLADSLAQGLEWEAHCAYLRDLQRVGRESLAGMDSRALGSPP
jgi:hypothetical protein